MASPAIVVTSPNTAVNWTIGTSHAITWTQNLGRQESVTLDESTDGGATWRSLATVPNTTNATGTFTWIVSGPPSASSRIRASWAKNPAVQGESAVNFTVAMPFIAVTSPNTAVNWLVGSAHNITFGHNLGVGQTVNINISRDGGGMFTLVNAFTTISATTGTFSWVVTGPITAQARIQVVSQANPTISGESSVNFQISP
jgi:hypothetical protein